MSKRRSNAFNKKGKSGAFRSIKQKLLRGAACCIGAGAVSASQTKMTGGFAAMLLAAVAKAEEESMMSQATVLSACVLNKCGTA